MSWKQQGFLIKKENGKITVDARKTMSIITNQLLADYLTDHTDCLKGRLLDLGCGEKPYKLIYEETCESSIGVDVETCKHDQKQVDVFASADNLPFEKDSFDTVLCTNVLEHVANMEEAFREIERVIIQGGRLIVAVPFLYPVHEAPYDFYRYTESGLKYQLVKNGFQVEKCLPWGGAGMLLCVYFHMFLGKVVKNKGVHMFSCFLQKITYFIIKKCCYRKMMAGGGKISHIITCGYFMIAHKQ